MSGGNPLKELKPNKEFFVGIDSDGCAFPTMELKHKECFIPNIVKSFGLQSVSKYAREAAEFVNLYSKWRGINRFPALLMVIDLLAERPEVRRSGVKLPDLGELKKWADSGAALGNPALEAEVKKNGNRVLARVLEWSKAVNQSIDWMVEGCQPFAFVRESLGKMAARADIVVVSATPLEALRKEWAEHGIDSFTRIIAGQELGSKKEHLALAAGGKYPPEKILMIGDAPGDMKAARGNSALFFPVNPGEEEKSWELLYSEAFGRFMAGSYSGNYEAGLIAKFEKLLPDKPPWKK
ncbi:MAG: haloacid dehalogenase [Candidatus Glassbacteria bacterium RIFCSPLOWO2_12_FULL_58_11]|uniref:Haloacid dehalogenase n=2 Tax=Candidatus Glassiibacteriota TaxID=1817805 RepID=A0A1F5YPK5_9BACT|nr:MAG: haloacid dehalogenase [Candidatus Glassbacteria bacterium GWA2_58_10]OGG02045.1 MAG: haloacid dehalogenase [Candidatus Glassbacteria bacterium RIFCSPLOWO2_12_FULL_58_11]